MTGARRWPVAAGRLALLGGLASALAGSAGCSLFRNAAAEARVQHGQELLADDDLESALAEFQAAAQLAPQMAIAHSKMGVIYRRMGDYGRAMDCFAAAVRNDPYSFEDTLDLAKLYHFTRRLRDAVQAYLHASDLKPDNFDTQLNLGVCYQEMGELQQAVERFNKAIAIDSDRLDAYVNLGVALDSQKKYYEAIHAFKEALERDNHQPLVLVNLAQTYMAQERLKMARQALDQALKMDPQLAAAHEAMAYCLFRLEDYDGAEQHYGEALVYDPRLPNAFAGLGSVHMMGFLKDHGRTELRERALEEWHRSLELEPNQPKIRALISKYEVAQANPETMLLDEKGR
ncbi:MAG TPA: tetratricopeptide repeat protein [Phycisphaerae bacterium]